MLEWCGTSIHGAAPLQRDAWGVVPSKEAIAIVGWRTIMATNALRSQRVVEHPRMEKERHVRWTSASRSAPSIFEVPRCFQPSSPRTSSCLSHGYSHDTMVLFPCMFVDVGIAPHMGLVNPSIGSNRRMLSSKLLLDPIHAPTPRRHTPTVPSWSRTEPKSASPGSKPNKSTNLVFEAHEWLSQKGSRCKQA